MTSLRGRTALVTGSSKGIGAAAAQKLASAGATVAIHYGKDQAAANQIHQALPGQGHQMIQADLSTETGASQLFDSAIAMLGHLDILVNNAGIFQTLDPLESNAADFQKVWQRTLQVNLNSPAHLSFLAAKHMAARGGGRLIQISSRGAFRGEPQAPAYGASKAGLNALSQSMAQAYGSKNVLVYIIAPGFVETAMARPHLQGSAGEAIKQQSPLHRVALVDEIAETVLFLADQAPPFMTGAILDINGASYLRS